MHERHAVTTHAPTRSRVHRIHAWVRAMRLQFYPMTWLAYSLGAVAAQGGTRLDLAVYASGFIVLVLLEMATVFTNELADYETDRRNTNAGPFNGGSRVLVEHRLSAAALRTGAGLALALAAAATTVTWAWAPPGSALPAVAIIGFFGILALGYTLPPLRLAYRGAAEITVAATHSTGPVLLGFVLQGGSVWTLTPWVLSVPLLLAILPSILLAGIPDSTADRSVDKHTLAVRRGAASAAGAAQWTAIAAALTAAAVAFVMGPVYGRAGALIGLHCGVLWLMLRRYRQRAAPVGRIDALMVASLSYLFWFTVLPLLAWTG
ncbi:MAG: prenyltransferase [Halofilum sp. (in: g-proteobacteria)]